MNKMRQIAANLGWQINFPENVDLSNSERKRAVVFLVSCGATAAFIKQASVSMGAPVTLRKVKPNEAEGSYGDYWITSTVQFAPFIRRNCSNVIKCIREPEE
jgi:hypothetical protein